MKYALVDDHANITNSGRIPAPLESKEAFVEAVVGLYDRFSEVIDGISISIPGYIDPNTGVLAGSGVYTALYGLSLPNLLKERIPVDVAVENDGKCAALAEAWHGSLEGSTDGAVIVLGTGVAGGIIQNKRVLHGRNFAAGEFSYFLTDPTDYSLMGSAFMSCGMLGVTYKLCKAKNLSFAAQDSAPTIEWLDSVFHSRYAEPGGEPRQVKADGRQFLDWLAESDKDAVRIYAEFISSLAAVVHNIQIGFAPEKIVVGGGLSVQDRVLLDLTTELERLYTTMGLSPELQAHVERSTYLDEGNVLGAAYNYLNRYTQGTKI